jgi:hypothetical protein
VPPCLRRDHDTSESLERQMERPATNGWRMSAAVPGCRCMRRRPAGYTLLWVIRFNARAAMCRTPHHSRAPLRSQFDRAAQLTPAGRIDPACSSACAVGSVGCSTGGTSSPPPQRATPGAPGLGANDQATELPTRHERLKTLERYSAFPFPPWPCETGVMPIMSSTRP